MRTALLILLLFVLAGCTLPSWRVGQKTIDAKMGEKPPAQTESERQGAKFIELKSAKLEADPAQQVADIHAVAVPLSSSLGEPAKTVTLEDKEAVIKSLQAGIRAEQKKADAWKAFAKKYHGTQLEGTGVDLAPWGGGLGLVALLAACVLVPGFGTFVLFVIRRLRGTVQQVAESVEAYSKENPDEAAKLKGYFSAKMDKAHKAIIAREKKYIDWAKVAEKAPVTS